MPNQVIGRRTSCPDLGATLRRASRFSQEQVPQIALDKPPSTERQVSAENKTLDQAKDLALALDDKLKLAPILARRLDALSHSSGSFSSKQSTTTPKSNSPRHVSPNSSLHEYTKLPSLLRTIEGRNLGNSPLVGSSYLPQIASSKDSLSPSATKTPTSHSFDSAKRMVDHDLEAFKSDAMALMSKLEADGKLDSAESEESEQQLIDRVIDIADECLESSVDDFKLTVTDIVDLLEEDRSRVDHRAIKALYTKLLFILTRCSRLLITEQLNLFATEPRNHRYPAFQGQRTGSAGIAKPQQDEEDPIFRCHTMPVKAMTDMVKKLHSSTSGSERASVSDRASSDRPSNLAPGSDISFAGRADGTPLATSRAPSERPSPLTLEHQFNQVSSSGTSVHSSSELGSLDSNSSGLGRGGAKDKKKPKSIFKKITNRVKTTLDTLKKKVQEGTGSGSSTPSSRSSSFFGSRPSSRMGDSPEKQLAQQLQAQLQQRPQQQSLPTRGSVRFSLPGADIAPPSSALRKTTSPGVVLNTSTKDTRVRFSVVNPDEDEEAPISIASERRDGGSLVRFSLRSILKEADEEGEQSESGLSRTSASAAGAMSAGDATCLREPSLGKRSRVASLCADPSRFETGEGSTFAGFTNNGLPYLTPPDHILGGSDEQPCFSMESDRVTPDELMVVCSICEEFWPTSRLEEHSEMCAVLRQLHNSGLSVDGMLTTLANVIEEQLEMGELPYNLRPEVVKLVRLARCASALQLDGSKVPCTRCGSIYAELAEMADPAAAAKHLSTITITYAQRMGRLVGEKINLLSEPIASFEHRMSDYGENSGTSTPRSAPGMSIDEFEIIKPISRGAFGRVYLARKHATGDLFAIKVMKKRDLIRKNMVESVNNERNILAMANNPFVVRFFYSFTSKENLYIVMEYLNGGDCYSLLRKFGCLDEDVAKLYISETVLALEYCHAQGIIHRDMKPDNMLISQNGHVKLTDFGLSCVGVIDRTDNLNGPQGPFVEPEDMDTGWGESTDYDRDSTQERFSAGMDRDSRPSPMSGPIERVSSAECRSSQDGSTCHSSSGAAVPRRSSAVGSHLDLRSSSPGSQAGQQGLSSTYTISNLNPYAHSLNLQPASSAPGPIPGPSSAPQQADWQPQWQTGTLQQQSSLRRVVAPEHEQKRAMGTPDYLSPELLLGTGHGPEVDWWALGCILYEFVSGVPPFNAHTPEEIFDNILDRSISWPEDEEDMSTECRDLIDKLLQPNPVRRLGHRGAGEIKMHPWFKGVDWTDLARSKVAFIPTLDDETDTSYFEKKHVSAKSFAEDFDKVKTKDPTRERLERLEGSARTSSTGSKCSTGAGGTIPYSRQSSDSKLDTSEQNTLYTSEQERGSSGMRVKLSKLAMGISSASNSSPNTSPFASACNTSGPHPTFSRKHTASETNLTQLQHQGERSRSVEGRSSSSAGQVPDPMCMDVESKSSSCSDSLEDLLAADDPFGNFSFTNYNHLGQVNVEKLMRIREQHAAQQRISSSGLGTPTAPGTTDRPVSGTPSASCSILPSPPAINVTPGHRLSGAGSGMPTSPSNERPTPQRTSFSGSVTVPTHQPQLLQMPSLARGSLPHLTAMQLQQQVNSLMRQQSNMLPAQMAAVPLGPQMSTLSNASGMSTQPLHGASSGSMTSRPSSDAF